MMSSAVTSIVELTKTNAGASLALRKGATRQLLAMMKSHASDATYSQCISNGVVVLQRCSKGTDADREALAKQNCR